MASSGQTGAPAGGTMKLLSEDDDDKFFLGGPFRRASR